MRKIYVAAETNNRAKAFIDAQIKGITRIGETKNVAYTAVVDPEKIRGLQINPDDILFTPGFATGPQSNEMMHQIILCTMAYKGAQERKA